MRLEALAGDWIGDYIKRAIEVAPVECEFNGAKFSVLPGETEQDIHAKWKAQIDANSKAWEASPEGIAARKESRERAKREAEKAERVGAMSLHMTVKPELADEYQEYVKMNSKDSYSNGVVDFGERWAGLLEIGISQMNDRSDAAITKYFVEQAEKQSHEADIEGLTGFMYGCAVHALSKFWIYGEPLRRWHNLDTQIGNEGEQANESGGVLNPAVLNIGQKSA